MTLQFGTEGKDSCSIRSPPVDVVVLSPARWATARRLPQFLALALAELGHRVLFVDPPVSPLSVVRDRSRRPDLFGPRVENPADGLTVWHAVVAPGQNSGAGQRVNAAILRRGIERGMPDPALVVALSLEARGVLPSLPGRHVYHVGDSLEDLPGNDPRVFRRREAAMLHAADVVMACSLPLCEQLAGRGAAPIYLPHGFDAPTEHRPPTPEELRGRAKPWIGYAGSLNQRIDDVLLRASLAETRSTLVLVGGWASGRGVGPPPSSGFAELFADPNVVATGHVHPDRVPSYLASFDVGVAPYQRDSFNRKSFPLKITQYLAAGIPVVSTSNGATDELGDLLTVADTPEDFASAVARAVETDDDEARRRRLKAAAARPWTVVADELLRAASA